MSGGLLFRALAPIISVVCFFGGQMISAAFRDPPEPSWTTKAIVTNVVDGDTIDVEIRRAIRVRLLDCWAPETHMDGRLPEAKQAAEKKAGLKAKEDLKALALGKPVILQVPTSEDLLKSTTMGRVLGRVWLEGDDESLSEKQVKSGNATKVKREELRR